MEIMQVHFYDGWVLRERERGDGWMDNIVSN